MPTKHEKKVAWVILEEWVQGGETLRVVQTIDGWTEAQVRRGGLWWPLEEVLD